MQRKGESEYSSRECREEQRVKRGGEKKERSREKVRMNRRGESAESRR